MIIYIKKFMLNWNKANEIHLPLRYWIVLLLWIFYKYFVGLPKKTKKKTKKKDARKGLLGLHWPGRIIVTSHKLN